MNEPKCRSPLPSANHVSRTNTAQIGFMSRANTRISELCACYVERLNTIFISLCETFFHAFYVTDLRYDTISVSWIVFL